MKKINNPDEKEHDVESVQSETEASKPPAQQKTGLVPLKEDEILEFDNYFPLDDENSWVSNLILYNGYHCVST